MKRDSIDLSEFGLDEDLNFDLGASPSSDPAKEFPQGREAILQLPKSAAKGLYNSLAGEGKRRRLILSALPEDYTRGMEAYDVVEDASREFIREARDDYDRTKRELRRTAKSALPLVKKYLPSSLSKRIEKFATTTTSAPSSHYDYRAAEIEAAQSMMEVHNATTDERADEERRIERVEDELRSQIDLEVTNKIHNLLAGIGNDTSFMRATTASGVNYRKKMIELNYRQLFAMGDLIDVTRQHMERLVPATEAIMRNTALPDYAKETTTEVAVAQAKRRMIESFAPSNFLAGYSDKLVDNLRRSSSSFFSGVSDAISGAQSAVERYNEENENLTDEERKAKSIQNSGKLVGSFIGEKFVRPNVKRVGKLLRNHTGGEDSQIDNFGKKFRYGMTTLPERLNDFAKDDDDETFTLQGRARQFLRDLLPSYNNNVATIDRFDAESLGRPKPWTVKNDISLNDTIPNWLSKIHFAITDLKGEGKDEVYDIEKRAFVERSDLNKTIQGSISTNRSREYLDDVYESLVKRLDKDNELGDKDREVLKKVLDGKLRNLSQFNINSLAEDGKDFAKADTEHDSRELRKFFMRLQTDKKLATKLNAEVSSGIATARDSVTSNQAAVNQLRALYGDTALVNAGVFNHSKGQLRFNNAYNSTYGMKEQDQEEITNVVGKAAASVKEAGVDTVANVMSGGNPSATLRDNLTDIGESVTNDGAIASIARYVKRIHDYLTQNGVKITPDSIKEAIHEVPVHGDKVEPRQDAKQDPFVEAVKRREVKEESLDIFVDGEDVPRLFGRKMKLGQYHNDSDKTPIYKAEDINSTVKDEHGNTVLSEEEMARPTFKLIDSQGNPVMFRGLERLKSAFKVSDIFKRNENKQETKNDIDGDGVRDGSFRDIMAKRNAAKESKIEKKANEKPEPKEKDDKTNGILSSIGSMLSSFLTKGGDLVKSLLTTLVGGGIAGKALGVAGSVLGGGAKVGGKVLGGAGRLGVNVVKSMPARAAANASMATSLARGVGTVASGVGTAAAWGGRIAAGALGVLSAPVSIGLLAATGAWMLYKKFSSEAIFKVDEYRYAQYGINDYDTRDSDEVAKIRFMEEYLIKFVMYDGGGIASLSGLDEAATKKLYEGLDIDPTDEERILQFREWFIGRFVPVFLLWTSRTHQLAPEIKFNEIKTLEPEVLKTLLDQVKLPADHPIFRVTQGVFDTSMWDSVKGLWGGNDLLSGPEVHEVFSEVYAWVTKQIVKSKKKAKEKKAAVKAEATTEDARKQMYGGTPSKEGKFQYGNAALEKKAKEKAVEETIDGPKVSNEKWYSLSMKDAVKNEDGTYSLGDRTFRSKRAMRDIKEAMLRRDKMRGKDNEGKSEFEVTKLRVSRDPGKVNAVDASRLKTYGLIDMSVSKVGAIYKLEERFIKDVIISGVKATYSGDWSELAKESMSDFGMLSDSNADRTNWMNWAKLRFAPVFLNHLGLVKQRAGNANPLDLIVGTSSAIYLRDIVSGVAATQTTYEGKQVPVWAITFSPFKNFEPNTQPESIDGNLAYLDDLIKQAKATEQSKDTTQARPTMSTKLPQKKDRPESKVKSYADEFLATSSPTTNVNGTGSIDGPSQSLTIPSDNLPDQPSGEGDYASIKMNGTKRADVANMLAEVSKLTGVDHNLLMTVAMAESSMNPFAGAKTSSAKGLFQFIKSTWKEQLDKYGNTFGIPSNASPMDPVANALLGAMYVKDGGEALETVTGRDFNATDAYLSHFMGPGGARQFLGAMKSNPDQSAAKLFPKPAAANRAIFYDRNGARSLAQMYNYLNSKMMSNWSHVREYAKGGTQDSVVGKDIQTAQTDGAGKTSPQAVTNAGATTSSDSNANAAEIVKISKGSPTVVERERGVTLPPPVPTIREDAPEQPASNPAKTTGAGRQYTTEDVAQFERRRRSDAVSEVAKNEDNDRMMSGLSGVAKVINDSSKENRGVLEKQLTAMQSIDKSLGFISKKLDLVLPDNIESQQLKTEEERANRRAVQEAPQIQHDKTPITMQRISDW